MTFVQPVVTSNIDVDAKIRRSNSFLSFCHHMKRHMVTDYEDRGIGEQFVCGSLHDGSFSQMDVGDSDIMTVLSNCCTISAKTHFVASRGLSVFRIVTAGVHGGFARLVVTAGVHGGFARLVVTAGVHGGYARLVSEEEGVELRHDSLLERFPKNSFGPVTRRHGPAICYEKMRYRPMKEDCRVSSADQAASVDAAILGKFAGIESEQNVCRSRYNIDIVPCIRCSYWPGEAAEWVKRRRFHGWPTQRLVVKIADTGCHFVAVAHKLSENRDTGFRFSFSKAENMLTATWSHCQRLCYKVMKTC